MHQKNVAATSEGRAAASQRSVPEDILNIVIQRSLSSGEFSALKAAVGDLLQEVTDAAAMVRLERTASTVDSQVASRAFHERLINLLGFDSPRQVALRKSSQEASAALECAIRHNQRIREEVDSRVGEFIRNEFPYSRDLMWITETITHFLGRFSRAYQRRDELMSSGILPVLGLLQGQTGYMCAASHIQAERIRDNAEGSLSMELHSIGTAAITFLNQLRHRTSHISACGGDVVVPIPCPSANLLVATERAVRMVRENPHTIQATDAVYAFESALKSEMALIGSIREQIATEIRKALQLPVDFRDSNRAFA